MKYLKQMMEYNKSHNVKTSIDIDKAINKHRRIHEKAMKGIYQYRPREVESVIKFIEGEFYKTTGKLELIKLEPCQKWWMELWFGYYTKDGDILINETFLNIIRGAGKSTIMSALEMYWMIYGGTYGGESQVIAYDNIQAGKVYDQVRNQITTGNGLLKSLGDSKLLKTTKTGIVFVPNKNTFRKQTNDVHRAQGGNTSLNIFDEVHVYKDDIVSTVNKGSRQKQKSWRSIYITSGGVTRGGLYDKLIQRMTSDDDFYNDRTMALIYRLDHPDEVTDESNWTKAAPMLYGGIPSWDSVREEYRIASSDPALQLQFLAYNMGVPVQSATYYLTPDEIKCSDYDFDEIWTGSEVCVGIDLALTDDLTAIVFLTEREGKYYVHVEGIRSQGMFDLKQIPDDVKRVLEFMPNLHVSERTTMGANDVIRVVKNFVDKYNIMPTFVGYDPSRYDYMKELIDSYFFDVNEDRQTAVKQGFGLSDFIKIMKEWLGNGTLIHNSELLRWSLNNFSVKVGYQGDLAPYKQQHHEKIDPVVAMLMALCVKLTKG